VGLIQKKLGSCFHIIEKLLLCVQIIEFNQYQFMTDDLIVFIDKKPDQFMFVKEIKNSTSKKFDVEFFLSLLYK